MKSGQRGLSLAETIVALFLAALLVVLLTNLFPGAVAAMRQSEIKTHALQVCQSILAQEQTRPFSELVAGTSEARPAVKRALHSLKPRVEVFPVPGHDPELLLGVRVTVLWETRNRTRELSQQIWRVKVKR